MSEPREHGEPYVSTILHGNQDVLSLIRSAFTTTAELVDAGRASLLLRDSIDPVLVLVAAVGFDPAVIPQVRVPIGQGIAGTVAARGMTLFGQRNKQSFISVPIVTDRGVEGVLNVTNRRSGQQYAASAAAVLHQAASHIGHLIQYGRDASRDPVSGLHNRRSFYKMLERELAQSERHGTPFAVAFLDLDNLKVINDRYGHDRGDEVINGIGRTIQRILRPYDFAARYGGDEFALLISGTRGAEGRITQRIEDALESLSQEMGIETATSIGVADWPEDGKTGEQLLAVADRRMYEHKRQRKGLPPRSYRAVNLGAR